MGKQKYTDWHHSRIKAEYGRTGSIVGAAAKVGCSQSYAWRILDGAGLLNSKNTEHGTKMLREARELYVEGRLSFRAVSEALRQKYGPDAPSHEWVGKHMRRLGVVRTKSETNRLWQARENGIDYEAAEDIARYLYVEKKWGRRRIAAYLKASGQPESESAIMRWMREDGLSRSVSEAVKAGAWDADTPQVRERWRRVLEVAELRAEGCTYDDIHQATGLSVMTIQAYIEAARHGRPKVYDRCRGLRKKSRTHRMAA